MAIANYYEQKPLILFTFKKLCNGEQRLAAQQPHYYQTLHIRHVLPTRLPLQDASYQTRHLHVLSILIYNYIM